MTDEAYVRYGANQPCKICCYPSEKDKPENCAVRYQNGKFCVMISGGIFYGGRTALDIRIAGKDSNIDGPVYQGIVMELYHKILVDKHYELL